MFSLWKGSVSLQFIIPSRCNWSSCSYCLTIATHDFRLLSVLPAASSAGSTIISGLFECKCWNSDGGCLVSADDILWVSTWDCCFTLPRGWWHWGFMAFLETAPPPKVDRASPVHDLQIRNLKHTLRRTCPVRLSSLMRSYRELDQEYQNSFCALKKTLGPTGIFPANYLQQERLGLGFWNAKWCTMQKEHRI